MALGLSNSLQPPQEYEPENKSILIMLLVRPRIFQTGLENKHWPTFPESVTLMELSQPSEQQVKKHSVG